MDLLRLDFDSLTHGLASAAEDHLLDITGLRFMLLVGAVISGVLPDETCFKHQDRKC